MNAGEIYLGIYAGWYSVRDEAFYAESEVVAGAAGKKFAPSGAPVEWVEEPSYFFRLSGWADRLLEFYRTHPDFILPASRRNEVVSFVAGGLRDLSVSRTSFDWGVPVPDDPAHVMYVWLDALTNYITAVGYPETECEAYQRYWPADIHMVGKDILRFHAVYWPAFLMAAGLEPPKRVFAHGWWTNEGQKISKSLGNIIDPVALVETFGVDAVRYFLMREVPFGNDGDFSRRAIIDRLNGDLANDFGNLAQRVLSMIQRYCDGKLPAPGPMAAADAGLIEEARGLLAVVRPLIDRQAIHEMLIHLWAAIASANRYVDQQAPWALKRTDVGRMGTVLYVLAEAIRQYATLALTVMPQSAERMLDQLAVPADQRTFASLGPEGALVPETVLPKPEGIFPRFVDDDDQKIA
jgi:methionyl-tRNA synthetase